MTVHHKHLLIKFSSKTLLFAASWKFIIGMCFVHMTIPLILDALLVASCFHCHRSVVMEVLVHISLSTSLSMSLKSESVSCSVVSDSETP